MVRISDPESLRGQNLTVWTSEDFPFRKGDLVQFDFSKVGIDRRQDGSLSTGMMPSKMEPNQAPEPTTTAVTPRADARVAPAALAARL
jgi:hypothetical protein